MSAVLYSIISVLVISLISFIGLLTLSIRTESLKRILIYLVSFAAGALFGDAFIHLLPEAAEATGFGLDMSIYIILGVSAFFILEKVVHWHHYHLPHTQEQSHPFAIMNLIGDGFHNFIDGLIIVASYLVSIPVGVATTLAVVFHEIPQEIGDFGVLIHGGFSKNRALLFNFISALTAFIGAGIALGIGLYTEGLTQFLVPFAAGGFIYIAGSDLIPELHKEIKASKSLLQFAMFVLGILIMWSLLFLE